ncbi:MAG: hypothetical protein R3C12_09805 [Planctomycetaceae bacterium]
MGACTTIAAAQLAGLPASVSGARARLRPDQLRDRRILGT